MSDGGGDAPALKLAPLGGGLGKRRSSGNAGAGAAVSSGACAAVGGAGGEGHVLKATGMTCAELTPIMEDDAEKLLLIDARPYSDYVVGHITGSLSVRLSSLMTRRLARGKLKLFDLIVNEQKEQFKALFDIPDCRVVVYDSKTYTDGQEIYSSKNPLHVILKALDIESPEKKSSYLRGGFETFKTDFEEKVFVPEILASPGIGSLYLDEPLSATIVTPGGYADSPAAAGREGGNARRILNIPPSEIMPFLYIGSRRDAANTELLQSLGITHILNATHDCPCFDEAAFKYHRIPVKDTWNQDLPSFFAPAFDFINLAKATSNAKCMVHCTAGISRSSTVTIAYVMHTQRLTLHQAYTFVKKYRDVIAPNLDFMGELMQFEKTLGITPTPPSDKRSNYVPDESISPPPVPTSPINADPETPTLASSTARLSVTSAQPGSATVTEVAPWPPSNSNGAGAGGDGNDDDGDVPPTPSLLASPPRLP